MPTSKGYSHKKLGKSSSCAAGSFRRVRSGKALVTVCCPKGKWSKSTERCRVGMKAIGLDRPLGDASMQDVRSRMTRIAAKVNCARCARVCR